MSIIFEPEMSSCPLCGENLVQKYNRKEKTVITLKGKMVCWERVLRCRNKKCKAHLMSFHSAEYMGLTLPGMNFGLDVVAFEGGLRLEEHRTIEEILTSLQEFGIHTNGATVSKHLNKFFKLISRYPKEKIEVIRKDLIEQGGYILQIDEKVFMKTKTLYIFRDNISGTILYSDLAKDDTDSVKPLVQYVHDTFGEPLGVVSDMHNSIIESVEAIFPDVPYKYFQYHFSKTNNIVQTDI